MPVSTIIWRGYYEHAGGRAVSAIGALACIATVVSASSFFMAIARGQYSLFRYCGAINWRSSDLRFVLALLTLAPAYHGIKSIFKRASGIVCGQCVAFD